MAAINNLFILLTITDKQVLKIRFFSGMTLLHSVSTFRRFDLT